MTSILVIEDGEADQFICKTMIEHYDPSIEVLQAYDGQEALDILARRDKAPAVILLDLNMPGMGGYEFLEHYKERQDKDLPGTDDGDKKTNLVVLTSSVLSSDREKSMSYGVVEDYVQKPLTTERVAELMNQMLGRN